MESLKNPIGCVVLSRQGEAVKFNSRVRWFFGTYIDTDDYIFDIEYLQKMDWDYQHDAPHTSQLVY